MFHFRPTVECCKTTVPTKLGACSLPLHQSLYGKINQNRHSRRIRQNRRFVGTPISSSIALWRNFAKIAILAEFARFAKIAASSVPLSRAQSLFGEISPKSPFSPNSPDSPKSPLRRYPYLELNRSLAKYRQNRHSRRIRRIRQNRRFVGTPISSSIALWRHFAKIAILAEFAGFDLIFGEISSKLPNLPLRAFLDISRRRDSNPRPSDSEASSLTAALLRHMLT